MFEKQPDYDHGAQPRSKVFDFFEENRMVWKTLVAQQRTNAQLNSHIHGPDRESNRGHLGERGALHAQANRATNYKIITIMSFWLVIYFC